MPGFPPGASAFWSPQYLLKVALAGDRLGIAWPVCGGPPNDVEVASEWSLCCWWESPFPRSCPKRPSSFIMASFRNGLFEWAWCWPPAPPYALWLPWFGMYCLNIFDGLLGFFMIKGWYELGPPLSPEGAADLPRLWSRSREYAFRSVIWAWANISSCASMSWWGSSPPENKKFAFADGPWLELLNLPIFCWG